MKEELVGFLRKILKYYHLQKQNNKLYYEERYRIMGYIEAILVLAGVFQLGQKFEYKMVDDVEWWIFFTRKIKRKETFEEMLLREAGEYLTQQEKTRG